jgi:hypothetical protein
LPGVIIDRGSLPDLKQFLDETPEGSGLKITVAAIGDSPGGSDSSEEDDDVWKFSARVQNDLDVEEDPERRRYWDLSHQYYDFLASRVSECIQRFR